MSRPSYHVCVAVVHLSACEVNDMAKTAFLYDPVYMEHETEWGHPESAVRLSAIHNRIKSADYYKDLIQVGTANGDYRLIESIHSKEYFERVRNEIHSGTMYLDSMDTSVCARSFDVALMAVGGAVKMCDTIMKGTADCGFCAVRPPGHHAEHDMAAGFCIFNNIAIAARYLQSEYGIKKVAIVDWDVHHGNGTQHSFENDNTVYYMSLHQYPYYPGTGARNERGRGKGEGYTLNIPMVSGSGDDDYRAAFNEQIVPALDKFKPEIILISAGYDAHRLDPLSSINLSTRMYGIFTDMILEVAKTHSKGRVIAFLEGGYNLDALAASVDVTLREFLSG